MSASREKKQRRESLASGLSEREIRQLAESKKTQRKMRFYTGTLIGVIVVFLLLIGWNSNILQKHATAVRIGDESFMAADVQYYFNTTYNQIQSNYGEYFSYIVNPEKSLKSQPYSETQSWYDFILEQALKNMQETIVLAKEAEKAGFSLSQEGLDDIESIRTDIDKLCNAYGITREAYYKSHGKTMTEEIFFRHITYSHLADEYLQHLKSQMVYSDEELNAYYQENPNALDKVDYRYYFFSGTADEGGDDTQAKASALAAASDMVARLKNGEDFTALTQEYAPEDSKDSYADASLTTASGYNHSYISSYVSAEAADWLFDSRTAGDAAFFETEYGYYVLLFQNRFLDTYNTVNVRHVLIQPEVSEGADEPTEEQKADAKNKAEELYNIWKTGGATEAYFAELAQANSADAGSKDKGGLYERVYKGQMVTAFNDWCFDPSRKAGDSGIVETDYGYHILYFVGEDIPYWKLLAQNLMMTEAYDDWYKEASAKYEMGEPGFGLRFVTA